MPRVPSPSTHSVLLKIPDNVCLPIDPLLLWMTSNSFPMR